MFQVRVHGRGGQGVVTAAETLSVAAFAEGHEAQAFPSFGSERMGAPVVSYCRIDDAPIREREPVLHPDAVLVVDLTLLRAVDVLDGIVPGGLVLLNSRREPGELGLHAREADGLRVVCVPATDIAREHLGRPLPNLCLLGAFAALTGVVSVASLEDAVRRRFSGAVAGANIAAVRAAYSYAEEVVSRA